MSASPDEQWLLYGKMDHAGSELMLVENFHYSGRILRSQRITP